MSCKVYSSRFGAHPSLNVLNLYTTLTSTTQCSAVRLLIRVLQKTMETHWGKHHKAYVTNLNKQIEGTDLDSKDIVSIVNATWNGGKPTPAFNNAAQTWSAHLPLD